MKSLFVLLPLSLLLLLSNTTSAQTGIYEYKSKSKKEDIQLNLRRDGIFFYSYNKEWTNCTTQGKWRPLGNGRVILNSDYQLTNYKTKEEEVPNQEGIRVIILSRQKGESPTTISSIFLNDDETAAFQTDGEAGFAMLEQRQRMMMTSPPAVRDSISNTDMPKCFRYNKSKDLKNITMIFDRKEVTFTIKNPKANKITITTAFAPNAAYHYMTDQEFITEDKHIYAAGSSIKLKKQRR